VSGAATGRQRRPAGRGLLPAALALAVLGTALAGRALADPGSVDWGTTSLVLVLALLAVGVAVADARLVSAHQLALVATLAAVATASRLLFAALPNVKPVTFLVLVSGVALGPSAGFMVGATTALVSNLFFGQGPWTPWQMLAWGAVGVLGGLLGRGGRVPGRWELVAVGALAAVAFDWFVSLWMFLSFTARTWPALLALYAQGLAFDAAHAAATALFAALAGPQTVALLARFRRRLTVEYVAAGAAGDGDGSGGAHRAAGPSRAAALLTVVTAAGLAAAAAGLVLAPAAAAARPAAVTRGLDYLHASQGGDGRFGDAGLTPWAALAVAAASEDPEGAAWRRGGSGPVGWLQRQDLDALASAGAVSNPPNFWAKVILAYVAAGRKDWLAAAGSRRVDLVERLLAYRREDGRFCPTANRDIAAVNTTSWALLALAAAGARADVRDAAADWLRAQQLADGGFGMNARGAGAVSDVDDTAAAVQALVAAGVDPEAAVLREARAYLQRAQQGDGGFSSGPSGPTYAESTAWALQAIRALGEDPGASAWRRNGRSPLDALRGLQAPSGAFYHRRGVLSQPLLTTTEAVVALSGATFARWPRGGGAWVRPFAWRPRVTALSPAPDATVASGSVLVGARLGDGSGGTGVAAASVRLLVDGRDVTRLAKVTASAVALRLTGVTPGTHRFSVSLRDRAGNAATRAWQATVAAAAPAGTPPAAGATSPAAGGGASPAGPTGTAPPSPAATGKAGAVPTAPFATLTPTPAASPGAPAPAARPTSLAVGRDLGRPRRWPPALLALVAAAPLAAGVALGWHELRRPRRAAARGG